MKFIPENEAIDIMLSRMNSEDKSEYLKALCDIDYAKLNVIHSKYGFALPVPVNELMNDDDAKKIASTMEKSPVIDDDIISAMFDGFIPKRMCETSHDDSVSILNKLHELDANFCSNNAANSYLSQSLGNDTLIVLKAYFCADVSGCDNLKRDLFKLYTKMIVNSYHSKASAIFTKSKIISEDRSKAKKGKTNRHQSAALAIACSTWAKYPNASLAGLTEEIYAHLHRKWNDLPVAGTIKKWLQDSGMNPDFKPKNRKFKLVVKGEQI